MMPLPVPYQNAKLTIYPAWRVWPVHLVARLFGVLVHVDGFPFGSGRVFRKNQGSCEPGDTSIGTCDPNSP